MLITPTADSLSPAARSRRSRGPSWYPRPQQLLPFSPQCSENLTQMDEGKGESALLEDELTKGHDHRHTKAISTRCPAQQIVSRVGLCAHLEADLFTV